MMVVARLYAVKCQFSWQKEDDDVSIWHCASLDGARRFIKEKMDKGDLLWYSIEGQDYIPCDEDDPNGQLYIGITHFEFHDLEGDGNGEKRYDIVLTHKPVNSTEYIGNDTVVYTLENGEKYTVAFTIKHVNGKKLFTRTVTAEDGKTYKDTSEFDVFDENLTTEDYAQWTADNWSEIEELIVATEELITCENED